MHYFEDVTEEAAVGPVRQHLKDCGVINTSYPQEVRWRRAEIEAADLPRLFMCKCSEFYGLSRNTLRILESTQHYQDGLGENEHVAGFNEILGRANPFAGNLLMVTDSEIGPWTFMDGNHRAILLHARSELFDCQRLHGTNVFVGIHPNMRQYNRLVF